MPVQKNFLPLLLSLLFTVLAIGTASTQHIETGKLDTLILPPLLLESIAGDVCVCVEGITPDRMRSDMEQDIEACFTVTLVENFEDLEAHLGDRIYNGTRLNQEVIEHIGSQLGERLLVSCPAFTRLIR